MFYPSLMRIFLLHGMARTAASMLILSRRLKAAGHSPSLFGYHVTVSELDGIAERLVERVRTVMESDANLQGKPTGNLPYAIVGHSLGNVIARLASPRLPAGLSQVVMLAPPNRSPVAARLLEDNPIFRLLTRDAGQKLADPEFFSSLPRPEVPILVVAGVKGPNASWLPFEGRANDCVLALEETHLEGAPHPGGGRHAHLPHEPQRCRRSDLELSRWRGPCSSRAGADGLLPGLATRFRARRGLSRGGTLGRYSVPWGKPGASVCSRASFLASSSRSCGAAAAESAAA